MRKDEATAIVILLCGAIIAFKLLVPLVGNNQWLILVIACIACATFADNFWNRRKHLMPFELRMIVFVSCLVTVVDSLTS